jgi:hypothetical protein
MQLCEELKAGFTRNEYIRQDASGNACSSSCEECAGVSKADDLIAYLCQNHGEHFAHAALIFKNEHLSRDFDPAGRRFI